VSTNEGEGISGLCKTMLDDALAYFRRSAKFGNVDGTANLWTTLKIYDDYGGASINLKQFWNAVDKGMTYEKAAFETFSGKWAKANGFDGVKFAQENIERDEVLLSFIKNK
jgi:hypothetical protein